VHPKKEGEGNRDSCSLFLTFTKDIHVASVRERREKERKEEVVFIFFRGLLSVLPMATGEGGGGKYQTRSTILLPSKRGRVDNPLQLHLLHLREKGRDKQKRRKIFPTPSTSASSFITSSSS